MAEKIKYWEVVKSLESQAIQEIISVKTSMKNILLLSELEKKIKEAYQSYVDTRNTFISSHSSDGVINRNSEEYTQFIQEVNNLLREDTNIKKPTEYIFTSDELEEKNVEISMDQARILNLLHILDIDLNLDDSIDEDTDKDIDKDIDKDTDKNDEIEEKKEEKENSSKK